MTSAQATQIAKPKMQRAGEFLRARLMDAGMGIKNNKLPIAIGAGTAVAIFTVFAATSPSKVEKFEAFVSNYSVKNLTGSEIRDILGPDWRVLVVGAGEKRYAFLADWQTLNTLDRTILERGLGAGLMCTPVGCNESMFYSKDITFVVPLDINGAQGKRSFTVTMTRDEVEFGTRTVGKVVGSERSTTSREVTLDFGGASPQTTAVRAIDAARGNMWGVESMGNTPAGADSGYVSVGEAPDFRKLLKENRFGFTTWSLSLLMGSLAGLAAELNRELSRLGRKKA